MKKALIFWGGWEGHQPELVAKRFAGMLEDAGYTPEVYDTLDCLADGEKLKEYELIVPVWTGGAIEHEYVNNMSKAIASGVGLAGCHGGMCDTFKNSADWQFITGGQWVRHPGGPDVEYTVNVIRGSSPLIEGVEDFKVLSEQYYLHVDPAVEVLASTRFPQVQYYNTSNKPIDMPVIWTKYWGNGRIYYTSLGHQASVFDIPEAYELTKRGLIWAAEGKHYAKDHGLTTERFENNAKMY